jgi:hypothetical protein
MHQMGGIGDRHQGNRGPIKGTASLRSSGLGLLGTDLVFAFAVFLVVVLAGGLVEQLRHFGSADHGHDGIS